MEASELLRRIFWRHRVLLLVCLLLPVIVAVPYLHVKAGTFTATAQVQGQGATPQVATEVQAIQGRVSAVATSPGTVQQALARTNLRLDPTQVARHDVKVTPVGSSAVMQIAVTAGSRSTAITLATALANVTVTDLNELGTQYNPQLNTLYQASRQLNRTRSKLNAELKAATAGNPAVDAATVRSLLSQLAPVEKQTAANYATVQQLIGTTGSSTDAAVISTPTYAVGTSHHALEYGALAALAGLLLGLIVASVREMIRPTVAQPETGARELGTLLLGDVTAEGGDTVAVDEDLTTRLSLAADRLGARTLALTGPAPGSLLTSLAGYLNDHAPAVLHANGTMPQLVRSGAPAPSFVQSGGSAGNGHQAAGGDTYPGERSGRDPDAGGPTWHTPSGQVSAPLAVLALPDLSAGAVPPDAALVVVLPRYARRAALDKIADLAAAAQWPILGVVGLRHHKRRFARPDAEDDQVDADD